MALLCGNACAWFLALDLAMPPWIDRQVDRCRTTLLAAVIMLATGEARAALPPALPRVLVLGLVAPRRVWLCRVC